MNLDTYWNSTNLWATFFELRSSTSKIPDSRLSKVEGVPTELESIPIGFESTPTERESIPTGIESIPA